MKKRNAKTSERSKPEAANGGAGTDLFAPPADVSLDSVLCTGELSLRPYRAPDYETESRALLELAQHLTDSPRTILQKLTDVVLEVFGAGSSGVSLVSKETGDFYWPAISGAWEPHVGGGTPRTFGPCGTVLDRDAGQMFKRPEKYFPYLAAASPVIREALLHPFYIDGRAAGTVWVISHEKGRKFDSEDLRLLANLAKFAAAAYQTTQTLEELDRERSALQSSVETARETSDELAVHLVEIEGMRRNATNLMEEAVEARQTAEQASSDLRESEERYRGIVNQTVAGIAEVDLTGKFITVNDHYCEIVGHSREELLDGERRMQDITHPDDLPANLVKFKLLAKKGTPFDIEKRYIRKDGEIVWAFNHVSAIRDAAGKPQSVAAVTTDITERKRREMNTELLATLGDELSRASDAGEIMRVAGEVTGRFLNVSRCIFSQYNDAKDEALVVHDWTDGGQASIVGTYRLSDFLDESYAKTLSSGKQYVVEDTQHDGLTAPRRDSFARLNIRALINTPYVSERGWKASFTVNSAAPRIWRDDELELLREVTSRTWTRIERVRAEAALRASENQLRVITDSMPALISYIGADLRYGFVNQTYTDWFGRQSEEVVGQTMAEVLGEATVEKLKPHIENALAGNATVFETEAPYRDGGSRFIRATYTPDTAPDGSVRGFFVLVLDITESRRVEEDVKRQKTLLEALNESVLDGILIVSPTGEMLHFNEHFLKIWNFPKEVLESGSDERALEWAASQTADPEGFLARVRSVYDDPDATVREELLMKDGRVYDRFGAPVRNGDTRYGWVWTFRDITERKRAEQALASAAARDEFRVKMTDTLRLMSDPAEVQATACRLLGEQLNVGRAFYCEVDDEAYIVGGQFAQGVAPLPLGRYPISSFGEPVIGDYRAGRTVVMTDAQSDPRLPEDVRAAWAGVQCRGVVGVPLVEDGELVAVLGIHDAAPRVWTADEIALIEAIAERIWGAVQRAKGEEAVRESERSLRTLFDTVPQLVWTAEPDGRIFWYNERWYEYTGTTPEEMEGWGWEKVHDPAILPEVVKRWKISLATGEPFEMEFPLRSATGQLRWFLTRVNPLRDAHGRIVRWFGTNTDVHDGRIAQMNAAFLADVSQDLARLAGIDEIMRSVGAKIGRHFGLSLCLFIEMDEAAEIGVVNHGWHREGVPNVIGPHRISDFVSPEFLRRSLEGETIVIPDVSDDPLVDGERLAAFNALGIGSSATVPLIRDGKLLFWLGAYASEARDWRVDEIELIRELAGRIWTRLEHARAEEALRASERENREILESITDAFFALDADWRFSYMNRHSEEVLGQGPGDLLGKIIWEVYPGTVGSKFEEVYRAVAGEGVSREITEYYPDHDRWYEVHAYPRRGGGLSVYFQNVTDRIKAEDALLESKEKYRTLFDSMDEGYCIIEMIFDDNGRASDYRFLEVNSAFERHAGIKDVVGKRMSEFVPDIEKQWLENYGSVASTGTSVRFSNEYKGLNKWFDVYAFRPEGWEGPNIAVLFKDITDQKLAEIVLRQSEARYRAVVESQSEMICRFRLDGTFLFVNQAYANIMGTTVEELVGGNFWNFIPESDHAGVREMLDTLTPDQPEVRIENRLETSGGIIWTLWTNRAIAFDKSGRVLEAQSTGLDITARKEAEEALQTRSLQLALLAQTGQELIVRDHADETATLRAIFEQVSELIGAEMCFNFLLGDEPETLRLGATVGVSDESREFFKVIRFGEYLCGTVAKRRERLIVENLQECESPEAAALCSAGVRCYAGYPLLAGGNLLGTLAFATRSRDAFREGELSLIQTVADQVAATIERARAEEALRLSEERLRMSTEAADIYSWEIDPQRQELYWGTNAASVLGFPDGSLREPLADAFALVHPEDLALTEESVRNALEGGHDGFRMEFRLVNPSTGEPVWLASQAAVIRDPDGAAIRIIGISQNITEKKRAEVALAESEQRFRLMADAAPQVMWVADPDGRVEFFNKQWFDYSGVSIEGKTAETIAGEVIHPDDALKVVDAFNEARRTCTTFEIEQRNRSRSGEYRWFLNRAEPYRDPATGEILKWFGVGVDIHDRKASEDEIRRHREILETTVTERTRELAAANQDLQHENRERRKVEDERRRLLAQLVTSQETERRRMARDLHDQLGQQLTALNLRIELALRVSDCDERVRKQLGEARALMRRIDADVDSLAWQLRPAILDDNGFVQAVEQYVAEWSERYGVQADFWAEEAFAASTRLTLEAETHLYRIIQEALNNIAKYAEASRVDVLLQRREGYAVLTVQDDGVGFEPGEVRLKASANSMGLIGMRERAALVEGEFQIETSKGVGTTVFVRIPLMEVEAGMGEAPGS